MEISSIIRKIKDIESLVEQIENIEHITEANVDLKTNQTRIKEIRTEIKSNLAQKSSSKDRLLDLDDKISSFGSQLEKRDEFSRDRDRILFSTAFRRLQHKAQVYSHEKGDHYRTRLTHTLEVMQISRSIARNLGLNEDLTEAIALGHDIGHTPFGHAGEEVLDEIMRGNDNLGGKLKYGLNFNGFKHNFHSLKILDIIEKKYEDELGLNLTWQVMEGILKHTSIKKPKQKWDINRFVKEENFFKPFIAFEHPVTLEGQVVNISDEIAQRQHDLDDGLRDIELRLQKSELMDHLSSFIQKIIEDIITDRKKELKEILANIKELLEIYTSSKKDPKIDKIDKKIDKSIMDLKTEEIEDEIKLIVQLHNNISQKTTNEDYKWKNIIRDVTSYFIHDVTLNTFKNIDQEDFRTNQLMLRENNKKFLLKRDGIKNEASLLLNNNSIWNRISYSKKDNPLISFSKTSKKFDEKIDHYIKNRIINSYNVNRFDGKAKFVIKQLFKAYYENPMQMDQYQLNSLSEKIVYNSKEYYQVKLSSDDSNLSEIRFYSKNPNYVLNNKKIDILIGSLKLDINSSAIKTPLIGLKEPFGAEIFLKQLPGFMGSEKIDVWNKIFDHINHMNKDEIEKVEKELIKEKILFLKCLVENHYCYLSVICDYIAGMTDNYAKKEYKQLYLV